MAEDSAAPSIASVKDHFRALFESSKSSGKRVWLNESGLLEYDDQPFLRHGLAAKIITRKEVEDRIIWLFDPPSATERNEYIDRILGIRDSGSSGSYGGLHTILLIVLSFASQSLINAFKEGFLVGDREERDENLPFTEDIAKKIFNSGWKQFHNGQFLFAPITISEGSFGVEYHHKCHLPYLEEEEIGQGTFGRVVRVKVERGHYRYRQPGSRNQDAVWLARKDFNSKKENYEAFKAENFILKEFLNTSNCPDSIMTSLSSYVQYPGQPEANFPSASIFFPAAKCSLKTYMEIAENYPGPSHVKRRQHVRQMLSISKGLEWLDQNLVYDPADRQYVYSTYYHCDLKPDNILVCEDLDAPDSVVFKIADFGEARSLERTPGNTRQLNQERIPVSGRAATFLAPEAQDGQAAPQVSGKSDVWAFGCIFLLVILFNYDGAQEIIDFNAAREEQGLQSQTNRGDYFFNPDASSGSVILNGAVTETMNNLITRTKRMQNEEIDATFAYEALKYLKSSIFVHYKSRHTIPQMTETLHRFYNTESPISGSQITHSLVPPHSKHCGISPEGSVFFYAPSLIKFYPQGPGGSAGYHRIDQKAQEKWSGRLEPTSRSCSSRSLCLVSAKPDDGALKFIIQPFVAPEGHRTGVPPLYVEFTKLRENAVQNVALSPNGQMIAIAIAWDPSENRAQVRLYRLDDIETNRSGSANTPVVGPSFMRIPSSNNTDNDLLRGAANFGDVKYNLDLCFSRDSTKLYHAATTAGHTTNLCVTAWHASETGTWASTQSSFMPYPDFTHRSDFLMRLVPLNQQVGVMLVTHDQVITKQFLYDKETIAENMTIVSGRKLSTVLISSDDKKIVGLVEESKTKHLEIWGGPFDSPRLTKKLGIMDKLKFRYNPKTDAAYLEERGEGMILHITLLKKGATQSFLLDRLFED